MAYKYKKIKLKDGSTRDQHGLVMEEYLGRKLDRYEISHHCDEDPQNNKIENLELMLLSPHSRHHMKGHVPSTKGETKASHGTISRYSFGCRCHLCKKAARNSKRTLRQKF